jgi:hypothetical protein
MPGRIVMKARWKNASRKRGEMNKLELAYSQELAYRKQAGTIVDWRHELFKLRLADNTTLTVDFVVFTNDGFIELHDCKGSFFPEHNKIKWKVAIEQCPWFTFVLVRQRAKKNGGGFEYERFE